jgi:sulfite reductase (NADPH) flavoprotein alpha-component
LGDRGYRHYCGFGQQLDLWLAARGSTPLFERIEVNRGDPEALTAWRHHVARLAGTTDLPDWDAPAFQRWRLARRVCLNPGSAGAPAFHLELEPLDAPALPEWEAGDLAQVQVPGAAEPREYSVASLPSDGRLHLLARQHRHADGSLGLASGWLTAQAAVGDEVALRLRVHQHFRIGDNAQRPLVLIGSGTGLAGLRAHLKARAAQPAATRAPAWLLFGERQAAHDSFHGDELQAWLRDGVLARLDRVYSRDGGEQRYVQHRLAAQAQAVRRWVSDGAAIYVCGSLAGMGQDVHATLTEVLGAGTVAQLAEQGRYRRDVY